MRNTIGQLFRYGVIGLSSNLVGYLLYLGLTQLGIGPKTAMSVLYAVGVAQTFLFNKKWTFRNDDSNGPALLRYFISYGLGYIINLLVLVLTVDQWGWPHQWVQGAMIFILALLLFTLQKFWVFKKPIKVTN
ncbi:GtrA family protein [Roseateles sp.]|uniref:GtrA family protein n=1 Tax=Roseateles sp. TaxID=1971397 RepID=UPI00286BC323|nr:GtrA family protein [Roseateles sp.]